jgi:hypothetical protein
LNTLIIHPAYTTRVEKHGQDVSSLALSYLSDLLTVVGPVNADFRSAFQFHSIPLWSRRSANNSDNEELDEAAEERHWLDGRLANESSVWSCGQDFWSTIGWAFNCSTMHPHRWCYWKTWLEFMLDVLEADWKERERLDLEAHDADQDEGPPTTMREESIIIMYMNQKNGPQGAFKAIMKALFADGGSLSASAFQEVFDKEPRGPKKENKKRKRADTLDLENDKFGDYFDDESFSSGVSEPPTPEKPRDARKSATFGTAYPGLADSVDIRLRLFTLISTVTFDLRKRSEIHKLYESYASALKVLPLEMFALFVSQRPSPMRMEMHVTTIKELFHLLLPSSYKDPHKVDTAGEAEGRLTMVMLEECYSCHPANTVGIEDNAKLSLVVESSVQLLWLCDSLEYTASLAAAVQKGIDARAAKVKKKRTGKAKADADDVLAREMLDASGERIKMLLDVMRTSVE